MGNHYQKPTPHLTRIIKRLFNESDVALLASKQGILNVSAFARQILSQVERLSQQEVNLATVITILSRYLKKRFSDKCINEHDFTFPKVKLVKMGELVSDKNLTTIRVKFHLDSWNNPHRFYSILARLAVYNVTVLRLTISNGNIELVVDTQQAGLATLALRGSIERKLKF